MRELKIEVSTIQEYHKKLNAYKELFGEPTQIEVYGTLEDKEGNPVFFDFHSEKVLKSTKSYLECMVDGEKMELVISKPITVIVTNYNSNY